MMTSIFRISLVVSLMLSTFACKQEEKQPTNTTKTNAQKSASTQKPAQPEQSERQGVAERSERGTEPNKLGAQPADVKKEATPSEDTTPAVENPEEPLDARVAKASLLAKEIEKNPENADAILKTHDLDREGLEALLYEIAKDPQLSAAYRLALAGE